MNRWFCETEKAKKQLQLCEKNKCNGCYKCVWIEESANAMVKYGTPIEVKEEKHPLYDAIMEKFEGEPL